MLLYNGQRVNAIYYNGVNLNQVQFNGVIVFGTGGETKLKRFMVGSAPAWTAYDLEDPENIPASIGGWMSQSVNGLPYSIEDSYNAMSVVERPVMQPDGNRLLNFNAATFANTGFANTYGMPPLFLDNIYWGIQVGSTLCNTGLSLLDYYDCESFKYSPSGAYNVTYFYYRWYDRNNATTHEWRAYSREGSHSDSGRAFNVGTYKYPSLNTIYLNENSSFLLQGVTNAGAYGYTLFNAHYVRNMSHAFYMSGYTYSNITGENNEIIKGTVCGPNTTDMSYAYAFCGISSDANPNVQSGVVNAAGAFRNAYLMGNNINSSFAISPQIRNAHQMYMNCAGIKGDRYPVPPSIEDMSYMYAGTRAWNSQRVQNIDDPNVIDDIPDTCTNMAYAFAAPGAWADGYGKTQVGMYVKSGKNVKNLYCAYMDSSVNRIVQTNYQSQGSMFQSAINMVFAFRNCQYIQGDLHLEYRDLNDLSNTEKYVNGWGMFTGKGQAGRINIWVTPDGTVSTAPESSPYYIDPSNHDGVGGWRSWNSWLWSHPGNIVGDSQVMLTWTLNTRNNCYYNSMYEIYVHYSDTESSGDIDLINFQVNSFAEGDASLARNLNWQ